MREQDATPPDVLVVDKAAGQKGQIATRQLRACGLDDDAILRRVRSGRLHRMHRGVYAVGHAGVPLEGRFMAAVLACGDPAFLSTFAGAAHMRFLREERLVDVTIIGRSTRRIDGVRVHTARSLDERDVWRHDAIPVTSPARTLLDSPSSCPRRRSELEDVVLDLLDSAAIERPEINVALRLDGARIVPDFLWREQRVVIEADGAAWHDHKLVREHDAERQAAVEALRRVGLAAGALDVLAQRSQRLADDPRDLHLRDPDEA
jgi:hypothetical protein